MRDVKRGEKIKKLAIEKERILLNEIIQEGIAQGYFNEQQCKYFEPIRIMIMQGVDYSYMRENFMEIGVEESKFASEMIEFIINALKN